MVEQWCYDYNYNRPHAALGQKTPAVAGEVVADKNSNFEWSEK
jgi:transposase InsO family protein